MGIDISTYAGLGILIPKGNAWLESFEASWEAYEEGLYGKDSPMDTNLLTAVTAQDSWSGHYDGIAVFVQRIMVDSDRSYMLKRFANEEPTEAEKEALNKVANFVGVAPEAEPIVVVTVT